MQTSSTLLLVLRYKCDAVHISSLVRTFSHTHTFASVVRASLPDEKNALALLPGSRHFQDFLNEKDASGNGWTRYAMCMGLCACISFVVCVCTLSGKESTPLTRDGVSGERFAMRKR